MTGDDLAEMVAGTPADDYQRLLLDMTPDDWAVGVAAVRGERMTLTSTAQLFSEATKAYAIRKQQEAL